MKESFLTSDINVTLKNKLRGIISDYRSQKFVKNNHTPPSARLRRNVKELFFDARVLIPTSQYRNFIRWVDSQLKSQLQNFTYTPIGFEELQCIYGDARAIDLNKEITWLSHRIANEKKKINSFVILENKVEKNVFTGKYEEAITILEKTEKLFGVSFWSVQLNIALIHISKGLEGQKKYTADVRAIFNNGLLNYVTYYTSVRNEDRTTLSKFNEHIGLRINNHKYFSDEIKVYMNYRLSGNLPKEQLALCSVLQVEQNNSIIDVYETFVKVLQYLVKNRPSKNIQNLLLTSLDLLNCIDDFRLTKLQMALSTEPVCLDNLPSRNTSLSDSLIKGRILDAEKNFIRTIRKSKVIDPWQYVYASFIFANKEKISSKLKIKPHKINQLMGGILKGNDQAVDFLIQFIKITTNLNGLKGFSALVDFSHFIERDNPDKTWALYLINLNSPTIGIEDFSFDNKIEDNVSNQLKNSVTYNVWTAKKFAMEENEPSTIAQALIYTIKELEHSHFESALEVLQITKGIIKFQPYRMLWYAMKLHALYRLDRCSEVIELLSDSVSFEDTLNSLLPIKSSLDEYAYNDFMQTQNPLSAPIALCLLWQRSDSAVTLSYIRTATRKALKTIGVTKPSELTLDTPKLKKNELVFFMSEICVPQVIDIIRAVRGSKEVLIERQNICRGLIEIDPNNKKNYSAEILDIEEELQMSEGKRVVDGTRIYVDMDALSRWTIKAMDEELARYKDLLDVKLDKVQNFDDIFQDIIDNTNLANLSFSPDNEADAILFNMVRETGYEFLTNPTFGLDFYLSKRIRHQSFIGLIRSHYEFSHLITTRESKSKDYDYNHYWIGKFKTLNSVQKDELNNALAEFAMKFDNLLLGARDLKFQINSEDCPEGVISLDYSPMVMNMIKAHLSVYTELDEFAELLNSILWALLAGSLQRARDYISNTLKVNLAHNVDKLKANVKRCAGNDPAYVSFEMELSDKSTEVQHSLDEVITWFTPLEIGDCIKEFSLEQIINIAIKGVLSLHKAFQPKVNFQPSYDEEIFLSGESLPMINDTFFILFDNVKEHSGIKKPNVQILVKTSIEKETLNIVFVNESKSSLRQKHEEELAKITALIDRQEWDTRAKKEGRSGIIKLAATTQQSSKADLKYGFTEEGEFKVDLTLPLQVRKRSLSEVESEAS